MEITVKIDLTDRTHSILAALLVSGHPSKTSPTGSVPEVSVQQYQPTSVNPAPARQQAMPAVPVAAPTLPNATTSAMPAAPATTYAVPTATPVNPTPAAPVAAAPTYAMEDLARAASQLMDAGRQQDLLGLLAQFGVQALTQLPKER